MRPGAGFPTRAHRKAHQRPLRPLVVSAASAKLHRIRAPLGSRAHLVGNVGRISPDCEFTEVRQTSKLKDQMIVEKLSRDHHPIRTNSVNV